MKFADILGKPVQIIPFCPYLAESLGASGAILAAQILYWMKDKRDWTFQTPQMLSKATGFSLEVQYLVRQKLVKLGVLEQRRDYANNRIGLRIDCLKLKQLLKSGVAKKRLTAPQQDNSQKTHTNDSKDGLRTRRVRVINNTINNTTVPSSENTGDLKDGFFEKDQKSFEDLCVDQLYEIVSKANKIQRKVHRPIWKRAFVELHKAGVSAQRIKEALDFYAERIGQQGIPVIYSAASFNAKFESLQAAMKRERPDKVEISPEIAQAVERLRELHWPAGSRSQLDVCVVGAVEFYKQWHHKMGKLRASLEAICAKNPNRIDRNRTLLMLDDHLRLTIFPNSPVKFAERWFHYVNNLVRNWSGWSGNLRYYIPNSRQSDFNKFALDEAQPYAGSEYWELYLQKINEN